MQEYTIERYMKFLGKTVRDKITGIEGTVTSISFDLNGCVQVVITQRVNKEGSVPETHWHDMKRVETIVGKQIMPVPKFDVMLAGTEAGPESKPVPAG